jgi:hypothetical protein
VARQSAADNMKTLAHRSVGGSEAIRERSREVSLVRLT